MGHRINFVDVLLTRDERRRLWLLHSGLASLLMAAAVVVMHYMTAAGLNDGSGLRAWSIASLAGVAGMFLLVRSGWSRHFSDPALTVPQMLYAVACAAAAYAIAGHGQGAALLMMTVALMFGAFGMSRRQALFIGCYTLAAFGAVMLWRAHTSAVAYPAAVQQTHFAMTCIFVFGVLIVADRLGSMRSRMRAQRTELAAALERISEMATRDELTGLANRRAMNGLLDAERERSLRAGHPWSVAILDIDHFKYVNDEFGHAAGDVVLRAAACAAAAAIRRSDSIARWGGEEFVLLLRDVDRTGAAMVATRVREALQQADIAADGVTIRITGSVGLAAHRPGEPVDATLSRADRALYSAKSMGRNRVVDDDRDAADTASTPVEDA